MHQLNQSCPKLTKSQDVTNERDCSSNVGPFYVKLTQASPLAPKQEVT